MLLRETVGIFFLGKVEHEIKYRCCEYVVANHSYFSSGFGDAGMMDFNFDGMNVDEGYDAPHVPPQPPSDGNADAAWYDTDL